MELRQPPHPLLGTLPGLGRASALLGETGAGKPLPTGFPALDAVLGGGLPAGRLCEVLAGAGGRASFLHGVVAAATRRGETIAWVDPLAALDVEGAWHAGVLLERVLWLNPRHLPEAMRTADLVLGSDGFRLLVLDLWGLRQERAHQPGTRAGVLLDPSAWNRLARRAANSGMTLLVLADRPMAASAAALILEVALAEPTWDGSGPACGLADASLRVRVAHRKNGRTATCPPIRLEQP